VRALMPEDASRAHAVVSEHFAATRYEARMHELLDSALQFDDPEFMALLAFTEGTEERLAGLVLFGTVAGARAVVKVHAVLAGEREPAVALLHAVHQAASKSAERLIVCELPDDTPFVVAAEALDAVRYLEEGRVPDYVCDGVALRLLVWRL
jgi:hypothetical protein